MEVKGGNDIHLDLLGSKKKYSYSGIEGKIVQPVVALLQVGF
jgi:hypothetical protein